MKTVYFVAIAFFLLLLFGCAKVEKKDTACFGEKCFSVELAKTGSEHATGLMFRESLPEDAGMLFVFDNEGIYLFWMKNTLIPLDMLWIDENNTVVFIKHNAQPCKDPCKEINPNVKAKYVLELNGGVAIQEGIQEGSKLTLMR